MSEPLTAGLAPGIELKGGYTLRVTALDPTTGDVVTGVVVSAVAIQVEMDDPPAKKIATLPPLLVHEVQV